MWICTILTKLLFHFTEVFTIHNWSYESLIDLVYSTAIQTVTYWIWFWGINIWKFPVDKFILNIPEPSTNLAPNKNHLYFWMYKWLIFSVARRGNDPRTSWLWIMRSNQLSYLAKKMFSNYPFCGCKYNEFVTN